MTFDDLKTFLKEQMRMSHIYQPVMIKVLLERNGVAKDRDIAVEIAKYDQSQIEYYQKITNNMVGKVLRNRKVVTKRKKEYAIEGFESLTSHQVDELISICENKLDDYIRKRGERIWQHRSTSREYISGTIKYEVLKRAQFRCELCGISAAEKALEVDHIIPHNQRGENSINNYQALCYSCNAMKRDRDATDFRINSVKYDARNQSCALCGNSHKHIIEENNLAYLIHHDHPVTHLHSLIIPKRHFSNFFEITQPELNAITALIKSGKNHLMEVDKDIAGFNIEINNSFSDDLEINHCHSHLIPRRQGDGLRLYANTETSSTQISSFNL